MAKAKPDKRSRLQTVFYVIAILLWVLAAVIASQLLVGYLMLWFLGQDTFRQPMWTSIYSALAYIVAMILIVFVPLMISRLHDKNTKQQKPILTKKAARAFNRKELGLKGWPTWTDIGLAPVGFVAQLVLGALLVALFSLFPWFDAGQAQDIGYDLSLVGMDRIWAFIALVILAPIAEEIIFRGWLYGKLRRKFSDQVSEKIGIVLSILLVSLLFGIVHLQWNVGVNVFATSIVLCGLREFTGTIYAGILLHMIKNGVAFYLLYVAGM